MALEAKDQGDLVLERRGKEGPGGPRAERVHVHASNNLQESTEHKGTQRRSTCRGGPRKREIVQDAEESEGQDREDKGIVRVREKRARMHFCAQHLP